MPTLEKLIDGYKVYKATNYERDKEMIAHQLRSNIQPTTLVITSSDLHIAPEVITGSNPGDMYVIRLKAGIVPPYEPGKVSGFTATLEFGVMHLQVQNIVVLGHSHNDGLQMLLDGGHHTTDSDPLKAWLGHAHGVYEAVVQQLSDRSREDQERAMELETIVMNLRNLFSYPWINERVQKRLLEIYGWHFAIESGTLLGYMPGSGQFEPFS
jgi:carbonic anhydrase